MQKLSKNEIFEIELLEKRYNKNKNIFFKLYPGLLEDDNTVHILHKENGVLISYMSLNCFDHKEAEAMAIFDSDKSIFINMFKMVTEKAKENGWDKVLIIIDRNDTFLINLVKELGLTFSFSEYRMNFDETKFNSSFTSNIVIQDATIEYLEKNYFGKAPNFLEIKEMDAFAITNIKLALLHDEIIGKARVEQNNGIIGIYGLILNPKHRGKGLGREILNCIIRDIMKTNYKKLYLEVEVENTVALNLYKSTGFYIQNTFDYYEYLV